MLIEFLIGAVLSILIAYAAYLKHSLAKSGFIAAVIIGTIIYAFGGMVIWAVLIAFFISSSLLTKLNEKKEKDPSRGRNYIQVISNGLVAAVFSVLYYFLNVEIFLLASVASIATSNSDTWASEIGILSKGKTRNIVNFKIVSKGVSGAISGLGTFASFIGALFIGLVFALMYWIKNGISYEILISYTIIVTICGFLGCFIDSYLGALIQAKYREVETGKITEKKWLPNEKVVLASGLALVTNDAVNFLSGLAASMITIIFFI
ncbi:MAG: DUF92 domain-containing protein [Firmicutes bacterium]|nr:DUF92 domain-containing protein [Bacillota bacterium]